MPIVSTKTPPEIPSTRDCSTSKDTDELSASKDTDELSASEDVDELAALARQTKSNIFERRLMIILIFEGFGETIFRDTT
jgi:hypothetical protein